MQLLTICLILILGVLLTGVVRSWWPRPAFPLYLQVEEEVDNLEWLLASLLRAVPRAELIIVDRARGETRQILRALARRYHLQLLSEAPSGQPLIYIQPGTQTEDLLLQYASLPQPGGKENARKARSNTP